MDTTKIIKGAVSNGRYTVTAPIVKEDYGLYLQIEGVELPSTYEVDFSNSENNGTSVTMIGNSDGVLIPHQFISTGKDVFAFLYHVGEDFGRTVYKFRIPNKLRPDRTNEEPTPEEQSTIDQAINALNTAVAQTAQDVISADQSAQNASTDADRAEQAKDDAVTFAQRSANSAQASAQSASASANSASQAQGYAQSASASAQSASGYASNAQTSANTASVKAQDASGYAQTASQKATESAQSASQALTYKTDAESAKTASQTAQGLAESARDSAVSAKTDAESARDDAETARDEAQQAVESISGALDDKAPVIIDTASGSIASFTDGADDLPLKSLVVSIEPKQDGSGDPSPDNVRPISGWTGMEIQHTKKNLLPLNIWDGLAYNAPVGRVFEPTLSDKSWTQNTDSIAYVASSTYTNMSLMTSLLPKGTYHYGLHRVSGERLRYTRYVLDKDFTVISASPSSNMSNATDSVTLDDDGYIAFRLDNGSTASQTITMTAQIEVGDTETAYEPYNGTTLPISWQTEAGTVYGGKLDVLTGILTVYPEYDSYNGETLTGEWISDRDKYVSGTTPTIGAQVVNIGAEGTEIQLEPHEVASLYGVNNIWADSGDTEVEYRANTKLYIEKLTQPEEDDMIADSAITSGQFFMIGNSLYRALANIASGATITVGTNAQRVSLSDALNLVNA